MIEEKETFIKESDEEKREKMKCATDSINESDQTVLQGEVLNKAKRKDDRTYGQERNESLTEITSECLDIKKANQFGTEKKSSSAKLSRVSFKDEVQHVSSSKSEGIAHRLRTESISGIAVINSDSLESELHGTNRPKNYTDSEDRRFDEKDSDSEDDRPLIGRSRTNSSNSEVTSMVALEIETDFQSSPISNPIFLKSEALQALNFDSSKSEDEGRTELGRKVARRGSVEKLKGGSLKHPPRGSLKNRPGGSLQYQPDYFHMMQGNYEEKYGNSDEERSSAESGSAKLNKLESRLLGKKNFFREKGKQHESDDTEADHGNSIKNRFRERGKYEESGDIDAKYENGSNNVFRERGKYEESDDEEDEEPVERESAKWAREEAQIGILKTQLSQINISHVSFGEKALLNDIEKDDAPIVGRGRSVTNAEFSSVGSGGRDRSNTEFVNINVFEKAKVATTWQSIVKRLASLWDVLTSSGLRHRPRLYVLSFLFVCLMLVADDNRSPLAWFRFYGVVLALDVCTALGDQFVFVFIVDKVFEKHFNIAYMLRGFHGPIGLLATLLILSGGLEQILEVTENFPPWRNYVAGIITVLVCICIKNYYVRQHYVALLQDKFADKLFQLQTWTILLSELATTKPPKVSEVRFSVKDIH
jgi:hypothetical protein